MCRKLIFFFLLLLAEQAVHSWHNSPKNTTNHVFVKQTMQAKAIPGPDHMYLHTCELGMRRTDNIMCNENQSYAWAQARDWTVSLRCPRSGQGKEVAYARIDFWLTTSDFRCKVSDGCIGCNLIELRVEARETKYFKYEATVYYKN